MPGAAGGTPTLPEKAPSPGPRREMASFPAPLRGDKGARLDQPKEGELAFLVPKLQPEHADDKVETSVGRSGVLSFVLARTEAAKPRGEASGLVRGEIPIRSPGVRFVQVKSGASRSRPPRRTNTPGTGWPASSMTRQASVRKTSASWANPEDTSSQQRKAVLSMERIRVGPGYSFRKSVGFCPIDAALARASADHALAFFPCPRLQPGNVLVREARASPSRLHQRQ